MIKIGDENKTKQKTTTTTHTHIYMTDYTFRYTYSYLKFGLPWFLITPLDDQMLLKSTGEIRI